MPAYTGTPDTLTAGHVVTAAEWLSNVRDPLLALSAASNSYSPTLGGFTTVNGTLAGAYLQVNKLIVFRASFTFGSSSAATTNYPTLTLPVTMASTTSVWSRAAWFTESGSGQNMAGAYVVSTTSWGAGIVGTSGRLSTCTTTTPFTWGTGDRIDIFGAYEAA